MVTNDKSLPALGAVCHRVHRWNSHRAQRGRDRRVSGVSYNPLMGYLMTDVKAGVLIGFVAALASCSWRGLLMFVLGLLAVAPALAVVVSQPGATRPEATCWPAPSRWLDRPS